MSGWLEVGAASEADWNAVDPDQTERACGVVCCDPARGLAARERKNQSITCTGQ